MSGIYLNGIIKTNLISRSTERSSSSTRDTERLLICWRRQLCTMKKRTEHYTPLKETWQEDCPPLGESDPATQAYCFTYFIRPLLAELLGVMFFVFVGVACLCPKATGTGRIATALAHAFILFVMVAVTANLRYGQLNGQFA